MSRYGDDLSQATQSIKTPETLAGKSILITGASGLVGSAVADLIMELNRRFKLDMDIHLAGRSENKIFCRFDSKKCKYHFVQYDIKNKVNFTFHSDFIVHCAAMAHPYLYARYPAEVMESLFCGTYRMLDYANRSGVSRFVYISSSEVYGNVHSDGGISEDEYGYIDILNARSCYPCGKRSAESLCTAYRDEYGMDVAIVRPGHIYGPFFSQEDSRASSLFIRDAFLGKSIVMKSAGNQLRSYCHSIDCATAILTVMLLGHCGEAYNISNKKSVVTVYDFAKKCAEIGGVNIVHEEPDGEESKGYNRMNNSVLDAEKLYALGWEGKFNLDDGLRETFEVLRECQEKQ